MHAIVYMVITLYLCTENQDTMYRDPHVYIADVEVMTGKSYRTCRRIMDDIRKYYGLSKREKPTMQQVKAYLVGISE